MDAEAFSESLQYQAVKKRAVASRSFRTKIPSSNGQNFAEGQTIQFDLPSNLAAQYYNFNQLYLRIKVTTAGAVQLDRNGIYNIIKRLTIQTAGSQLCDIINYNALVGAFIDLQASHEWKASSGAIMCGMTGDSLAGEVLAADVPRVFCFALPLNVLASTTPHRLVPAFSLSNLQVRIQLASGVEAFVGADATDCVYAISEPEIVCMMTQLSPGAQSQIDQANNGQYNILALNYMNAQTSMATDATTVNATLGFSMSSLERILVLHRKSDAANGTATVFSNSRIRNNLTEYSFLINSEQYPQRPILVDADGAEVMAETLISDHRLTDFTRGSNVNVGYAAVGTLGVGTSDLSGVAPDVDKTKSFTLSAADATGLTPGAIAASGTAADPSNIGTFIAGCEFESSLSDGKSSNIYSGISTIASTIQYKGIYAPGTVACQLDFFAVYTVLMSLDMNGLGVYQIRV